MDPVMLFYVAIVVFSLMIMGLVLTFWEFTRGAPHRQAQATQDGSRPMPVSASAVKTVRR